MPARLPLEGSHPGSALVAANLAGVFGASVDLPTLDLSTRIANFLYLAFCLLVIGEKIVFCKLCFYSRIFGDA